MKKKPCSINKSDGTPKHAGKVASTRVKEEARALGYWWEWDWGGEYIVHAPDGKEYSYWNNFEEPKLAFEDDILRHCLKQKIGMEAFL